MALDDVVVLGWARSPVAPAGGALRTFLPHELAAPVARAILERTGVPREAVDAVVAGNALGAGGNPARMVSLAAGLPDRAAAFSVDTQCCAGLDAVILAAGLLATGAAGIVLAGGVESWSRAPIRQHRPLDPGDPPVAYERPAFAPDPARDPDLLAAAAALAAERRISRAAQDGFAATSHARALAFRDRMRPEIVPLGGLDHDPYARSVSPSLLGRLPIAAGDGETAVSRIALAPRADGAAFVLLATHQASAALGVRPRFVFDGGASVGDRPEMPMLAVLPACHAAMTSVGLAPADLWGVELHEAFAVQALCLIADLGLGPARVSRGGGGLARGHPIGASGAVSLVRLLADMDREAPRGARGLAAIAAAGGLGTAVVVERF